ncbi:ABC transporter substrate-binding protein [bacterium]|nr:ABC transporter substrate-binding protein [bacterium]
MAFKTNLKIAVLFIKRNFKLILLGVVIGAFFFFIQKKLISWKQKIFPSRLVVGVIGKYNRETLPLEITKLISFGLTKLSSNDNPLPGAATSWEIKNQGKRYLFHLDPLLHWQDKTPLKAKDVSYQIEGVKIFPVNDYTLAFDLEKPFAPLPALVSLPLFKENLVGLGDYKVTSLRVNAGFFSRLDLLAMNPNKVPKKITFRFYPGEKELLLALKLGEIDCAYGLSSLEPIRGWPNLTISPPKKSTKKYVAIFFNTAKSPFDSKRFRQALAYSIHKPKESVRALTPISPLSWAYNPNVKTYPFSPKHAKELFSKAEKEATLSGNLKIQITTTFELSDWGEKIKKDWKENLGIETELKILPFIPKNQDFDVILGYGVIPPDPDQYMFWHSNQPANITKFSNPRIDKLLEEGRVILNKEERKRIYWDFQKFLSEEVPAIFLFYPTTYNICQKTAVQLNY